MKAQLIDGGFVALTFPYNPHTVEVVKRIPGRAFNSKAKFWYFPVDGLASNHLTKLKSAGFTLSPELERLISHREAITPVLEPSNASLPPVWGHLYPFQKETAEWMCQAGNGLVSSFCGSGKTITTIAATTALGCQKVLIVCPKSVLINWEREIHQWLSPTTPVGVVTGSPSARRQLYQKGFKFYILTYDTLRIDIEHIFAHTWDAVVFDEVHYLVNISSKRHKAARILRAKHRFGLTATPIMNSAIDIYGVMRVVGHDLGNYKLFMDRYCERDMWGGIKKFRHMDELSIRIRPWLIRKTLDDTHFQLPEKTETDLIFELSEQEASLYDRMKKELLFELEAAEVSKLTSPVILQNTLVKLGKLQELTDSCELLGENTQSSKLEILKEHLSNNLQNNEKAIIFTRFSRMAEILGRALSEYSPCVLTGQSTDRQGTIDSFTTDPNIRIFISTEAGNAGINLQVANIVYNYDLPFSLGKLEQRMGRIRWHMQDRPVFFYNLIATLPGEKQTVDGWVKEKIINKQEISDRLLISDIKEALE